MTDHICYLLLKSFYRPWTIIMIFLNISQVFRQKETRWFMSVVRSPILTSRSPSRSGGGQCTTSTTWSCLASWSPQWRCWASPYPLTPGKSCHSVGILSASLDNIIFLIEEQYRELGNILSFYNWYLTVIEVELVFHVRGHNLTVPDRVPKHGGRDHARHLLQPPPR